MKIYITDLEAYNNGHLVGEWFELPMSEDSLREAINGVLSAGKKACNSTHYHEEVFITDYEADIKIAEYENIYNLNDRVEILEGYSEDEMLKLKLLSYEGYNKKEVIDTGLHNYDVEIYDFRDGTSLLNVFEILAEQFIDEGLYGEIPEGLECYLDYGKLARDLSLDYCEFESGVVGRVL